MKITDPFAPYRQKDKGVYIATKTPTSHEVLVHADNYKTFEKKLEKKGLADKAIAVQYLEPKHAICAY